MSTGNSSIEPSIYTDSYTPSLLHPIERARARARLGVAGALPFVGEDLWTGYEFSWLNASGKPVVAALRLRVPCASPNLVESKSMKLYLNGFAQVRFGSREEVEKVLEGDLASAFGAPVTVELPGLEDLESVARMPGESLDALDIEVSDYERKPELLMLADAQSGRRDGSGPGPGHVEAAWHTDLFRSLCPMTGQPDWASLLVAYRGPSIEPAGLLRYLVSYRRHAAFHEDTVERIFVDIMQRCAPTDLTVYGRFLRRGGIDINPFRSTSEARAPIGRLARQ